MAKLWDDQFVRKTLVIAFAVIVGDEAFNGRSQGLLAEADHSIQAGILDASHKSLRVGVQIQRPVCVVETPRHFAISTLGSGACAMARLR